MLRDNKQLWVACIKNVLELLTADEKGYVTAAPHYAMAVLEDITTEYQRRFNAGEEVTIAVKPYFEYLCQELFQFYTGQKNVNLLQTFSGLLKHI